MPAVAILLLVLQIGGVELSPRWLAMCGRGVIIVVWVWSLTWSNCRCGLCGCTTVVGAVMGHGGKYCNGGCGNVLDYCLVEL